MSPISKKDEFYNTVDQVILTKGEGWFNAWTESNPITNFQLQISDDELSEMILDSEVSKITSVDYSAMIKKLEADMYGN